MIFLERCKKADSSKKHAKNRVRIRNVRKYRNISSSSSNIALPANMEQLQKLVEDNLQIASCNDDLYEVKEVHKFTMALADFRAEDFEEWIKIGWTLHACDPELLFSTWILFSTKSEKFDYADIPSEYLATMEGNGFNVGTRCAH